jgi:hypothetical protein
MATHRNPEVYSRKNATLSVVACGHDEVTLVLAVSVVDDDHHLLVGQCAEGLGDG